MTVVDKPSVAVVTPAMVRAVIDLAVERRYSSHDGALGIRGRLASAEHTFDHAGTTVRAVNCRSALAVREQLLTRDPGRWLVVVTERGEDDLGAGVLAHLVGQRLRTPDPWQAVRQRFGATAVDAQLTARAGHGAVALGLLEVMPSGGWTPAPAGLLTRDHAFGAVARRVLDFADGPVDLVAILGWTTRAGATGALADLRSRGGDPLADAVVGWIAGAAGRAGPLVELLLSAGRATELVPLGLVVAFLDAEPAQQEASRLALARLQHRWTGVPMLAVQSLGGPASTVTATLLTDARRRPDAQRALAAADGFVVEAQAQDLVGRSPLLGSGLERRFTTLAQALRADPVGGQGEVEAAWTILGQHALAETDSRTAAFQAAVRLFRWLGHPSSDGYEPVRGTLAALAGRQLVSDGWVDAAVNDAAAGADGDLGSALGHVLTRVQTIRDAHDSAFAQALAAEGAAGLITQRDDDGTAVYPLERVLPEVVIPLAQQTPVLLLVLDGLSVGVAVEVLDDLLNRTGSRWAERLLPGSDRRAAGLAVLPSITDVSRTSLLAGDLQRGQQQTERTAYAALTTAYGLSSATLFHKKDLDTITPGFAVADRVRASIDDPDCRLVSCVLNTIDDALDRSDPAGTHWTIDLVKHLGPLLDRAREAGRTVVMTSDHGHIVERRQTVSRSAGTAERPARYRPANTPPLDDEVVVRGERVIIEGNVATLAVSERLRYGPLKAGYHGGAAPAEVVVPLVVVVPMELAQTDGVRLAPPQEPAWWFGPQHEVVITRSPVELTAVVSGQLPTLFDEAPEPTDMQDTSVGDAVADSSVFAAQRALAGRVSVTGAQVARLVDQLVSSGHGRLGTQQAAQSLQVPVARLTGAFEQVRKLLNVEGYPVVTRDPGTQAIVLDEHLLREQFGLGAA